MTTPTQALPWHAQRAAVPGEAAQPRHSITPPAPSEPHLPAGSPTATMGAWAGAKGSSRSCSLPEGSRSGEPGCRSASRCVMPATCQGTAGSARAVPGALSMRVSRGVPRGRGTRALLLRGRGGSPLPHGEAESSESDNWKGKGYCEHAGTAQGKNTTTLQALQEVSTG